MVGYGWLSSSMAGIENNPKSEMSLYGPQSMTRNGTRDESCVLPPAGSWRNIHAPGIICWARSWMRSRSSFL